MNDNPLFSKIPAEKINEDVSHKISEPLFVFCDYNPNVDRIFSTDALFGASITNFYKLVIDASICRWMKNIVRHGDSNYTLLLKKIKKLDKIANILRNAHEHNQSPNSPIMNTYTDWLCKNNNGKIPDNAEEFLNPLNKIECYARELMEIMGEFIVTIKDDPNKSVIIQEWVEQILQFYGTNKKAVIKEQFYIGMLAFYHNKPIAKRMDDYTLGLWVVAYIEKEERNIKDICDFCKKNNDQLTIKTLDEKRRLHEKLKLKIDSENSGRYPFNYLTGYLNFIFECMREKCTNMELNNIKNLAPDQFIGNIIFGRIERANIQPGCLIFRPHK